MIVELKESEGNTIGFRLTGKLTHEDYEFMVPQLEKLMEKEGKVNALMLLEDFDGWEMRAAWDDLSMGVKHFNDFERIALVGHEDWEEWMATLAKPFTTSQIRYFDAAKLDEAWSWVRGEK